MVQRIVRTKILIDNTVSSMLSFAYRKHKYKLILFIVYICLQVFFIMRQKQSLILCVRQILYYEIWWYLIDIAVIVFPYIIIELLGEEEGRRIKHYLSNPSAFQNKPIIILFETLILVIGIISLYGLMSGADSLIFLYGRWYGFLLIILIGIPLLAPCFFNMFIVVGAFWKNLDETYKMIDDKNDLLKNGTQKIKCYKKVNTSFYCIYIGFLIVVTIVYWKSRMYKQFIVSIKHMQLDYNFLMFLSVYGIPMVILISYYVLSSRKIRKNLTDAIIRIEEKKALNEHEQSLIKYVFFNKNSPYYIRNMIGYPLMSFVITIVVAILPNIVDILWG